MTFDVAVVGLGGMGSAVVAHLAARGVRVVGLERFARGHALGASTGKSRLIRRAYFEAPAYVPLLQRAYVLWDELERRSGEQVLTPTGLVMVGGAEGDILSRAHATAAQFAIPLEVLDTEALRDRFPMLRIDDGERGLYESGAGMLAPERAVAAHLAMAEQDGADLRFGCGAVRWTRDGDGFTIEADTGDASRERGAALGADRLVLALGPWAGDALRAFGIPLRIQRNVQAWFAPLADDLGVGRLPAFLFERPAYPAPLYGFPDAGAGVKAAFHGSGETTSPDALDRVVHDGDLAPLRRALASAIPAAAGPVVDAKACMYALTPDEHFVVGIDPRDPGIVVAAGFSGHGFKFCSVVGEICADLATTGGTSHDIAFLAPQRFGDASS
ncbi:MAG: N-methyl-L-tryptophan oxidase [Candidatus Eremiobacteraeota bacterium]|nr:N-methyl-L-tryptophan oxidase [Candidatus Eremiobacteraeota bacterium]